MRLFANDRVVAMMDRLGMDDTQPIEAKMVTGAIEKPRPASKTATSAPANNSSNSTTS